MLTKLQDAELYKLLLGKGYKEHKDESSQYNLLEFRRKTKTLNHSIFVTTDKIKLSKVIDFYNFDNQKENTTWKSKQFNVRKDFDKLLSYLEERIQVCDECLKQKPPLKDFKGYKFENSPKGWTLLFEPGQIEVQFSSKGKIECDGVVFKIKAEDLLEKLKPITAIIKVVDSTDLYNLDNVKYKRYPEDIRTAINADGSLNEIKLLADLDNGFYNDQIRILITQKCVVFEIQSTAKRFKAINNIRETVQIGESFEEAWKQVQQIVKKHPGYEGIFPEYIDGSKLQKQCIFCEQSATKCDCNKTKYEQIKTGDEGISEVMIEGVLEFLKKRKIKAQTYKTIQIIK